MKVIIADDEIHVCSLLKHLIDWEGLGLTLIGVFHNGNDVVKHFEKEPADILICDIEMPGMSGNDLIKHVSTNYPQCKCMVISGFRVFEYARSAMEYGVTKYLLKPIDGDELNADLKSIITDEQGNKKLTNMMETQSIRQGLLDKIKSNINNETVEAINRKYQFHFQEGRYAVIKIVFTNIDINSEILPKLTMVFSESLKQKLMDFCYETEIFRISFIASIAVINYPDDPMNPLSPVLDQVLRNALEELGAKTQYKCFLGVGTEVDQINSLKESWESAQAACCSRISTNNKQIYYAKYSRDRVSEKVTVDKQNKQRFVSYIEAIDTRSLKSWVDDYYMSFYKLFEDTPVHAFDFCFAIIDLMIRTFDDLDVSIQDKDAFHKHVEMMFDNSSSILDLKMRLIVIIEDEVNKRLHEKQQNISMYAQQVKNYINAKYAENITLELLAEKLHITPVHLSVVFKSETGMNYSKYLTSVRIEKSKELLKNHDLNLTQITNAVGYDSTTYFSKLFKKHVGIKPVEFRRLHQSNLG